MFLLGIVGTPGAGKSSAAEFLSSLGAHWINADVIAHDCFELETVRRTLGERFGSEIFSLDGQINRAAVAARVFGPTPEKAAALDFLESVVHPIVRQRITEELISAAKNRIPVALLDVPLLFESGWDRTCDAIWCVDADLEIRLRRTAVRGWDREQLQRRESSQIAIETKRRLSNRIMRNDSTLQSLHENLRDAWQQIDTMKADCTNPPSSSQPHCQTDISPTR